MTSSWVAPLVLTLVGGGGVAIGTGLYKLGRSLGEVAATLKDHEDRIEQVEARQWAFRRQLRGH